MPEKKKRTVNNSRGAKAGTDCDPLWRMQKKSRQKRCKK